MSPDPRAAQRSDSATERAPAPAPDRAPGVCVGCGAAVTTRYCPTCGQDERRARLTWAEIWRQCQRLSSVDGPVLVTVRGLLLRPGPMIRDYLDAHRRRYAGPIGFALGAGGVAVVAQRAFLDRIAVPDGASDRVRAVIAIANWMSGYSHLITLAVVPVLAVVLTAIARGYGRTSAEHTVFGLYAFAGAFLIQALLLPLTMLSSGPVFGTVFFASAIVYVLWAGVGYLGGPFWPAFWRVLVADAALYGTATALQLGFVRLYVWLAT
ncbi:MAG: DUF3667 domain-containing protein [Planctomycetota bacterium]